MLASIRNIANNLIMKIVLGAIAVAFIAWGVKDALQSRNNFDIVTFSDAKNISQQDFYKAKSEEISIIQKQNATNLTEEDIKNLRLDEIILKRLINDHMLDYLVRQYELNVSDDLVFQFIKESPLFKNDKNEFDVEIFKSSLRNSYQSEEQYLENIKGQMLKSTLVSIFLESFKVPNLMIQNIVNYMAETKSADIIEMDLANNAKISSISAPKEEQLQEFYKNNPALFTIAEMRSFSFVKIETSSMQQKVAIADEEIQTFFDENKEELKAKTLDKAKLEIQKILTQQKMDELIVEFAKTLEDNIAAGSTLKEIAEKYGLELQNITDITYDKLKNHKTDLGSMVDTIFELAQGEVSYPIELKNNSGLMIIELSSIKPNELPKFETIKDNVLAVWKSEQLKALNLKTMQNLANNYAKSPISAKDAKTLGVVINGKFSLSRLQLEKAGANLEKEKNVPIDLMQAITYAKKSTTTPVFTRNNKAYFAYIKDSKLDKIAAAQVRKESTESISTNIKNALLEELIGYCAKQNKMKIDLK